MKFSLVKPFLSLMTAPEQTFPDLTIITGVNGAGKSHFLKAISNGSLIADITPNGSEDVRMFDWLNLAPTNEVEYDGTISLKARRDLYSRLEVFNKQPSCIPQVQSTLTLAGVPGPIVADLNRIPQLSAAELERYVPGKTEAQQLETDINRRAQAILSHFPPEQRAEIQSTAAFNGRHVFTLRSEDFLMSTRPSWGDTNLFEQSFGRLFVEYRDTYVANKLRQLARMQGDKDVAPLEDEDFFKVYGGFPWDFVNSSLRATALNFMIDHPSLASFAPYRPQLRKSGLNSSIRFDGLSSGERVLMSFAFAVYYANDKRLSVQRPKILLLDEVDAPLHPSMCRKLLNLIQSVLIEECKLKVIMTTHSATTVALSPEDSIFVMHPDQGGLSKVSKNTAIQSLTDGIPTLSLSYEGRRQIFVESPRDVEVYQSAFAALRQHLSTELTLNFIATGVEDAAGKHLNTGCTVVRRIVASLRESEAKHTFGLIDWDGKNKGDDGIIILAEGERNGLESVFFDPLLLLNTLVRHNTSFNAELNLPDDINYITLPQIVNARLQAAVDQVQFMVLRRERSDSIEVNYVGGFKLLIDSQYLTMDDHNLEARVDGAFPQLRAISKRRVGELTRWISRTILLERVTHAPMCLLTTFQQILGR